jgi:TPR repeat protein
MAWPILFSTAVPVVRADGFEHSYALIVGIGKYSSPRWKRLPLKYAVPDAMAVSKRLKQEGYEVTELFDDRATKANFDNALSALAEKLGPNDRVIVFVSGHGTRRQVVGRTWGYLVPYDGADFSSYISASDLMNYALMLGRALHQLFIIDACYGELLATRGGGISPDTPNYIERISQAKAREFLSAGEKDQEVLDSGPNGHSVFTNALLDGLAGKADSNGDGYITLPELVAFLEKAASNEFQTPASGSFPGHEGGEFVFRSPNGGTTTTEVQGRIPGPQTTRGTNLTQAENLLRDSRFTEAARLFSDAAESGDPEAQFYLGLISERGWGVTKDYQKARILYEKASRNAPPNSDAMTGLGRLFESGHGVTQDYETAREWYTKAADLGNADAMTNLGRLHEVGHGVAQDYQKARVLFEKAASATHPSADAMNHLGLLYANGDGVARDYQTAHKWYEEAASLGSADAMKNLGLLYEHGNGVTRNEQTAREWFGKAIATGDASGLCERYPPDRQIYCRVPKGTFQIGCDSSCTEKEHPQQATIPVDFYIGQTEVTVRAYHEYVMRENERNTMPKGPTYNRDWNDEFMPMTNITLAEARAFCDAIGGRLPTGVEWERAARAGKNTRFPWGNQQDSKSANSVESHIGHPVAVGSYARNDFGLFDMVGNVSEWTSDEQWKNGKIFHTARGGSYQSPAMDLGTALWFEEKADAQIGFRCVIEVASFEHPIAAPTFPLK